MMPNYKFTNPLLPESNPGQIGSSILGNIIEGLKGMAESLPDPRAITNLDDPETRDKILSMGANIVGTFGGVNAMKAPKPGADWFDVPWDPARRFEISDDTMKLKEGALKSIKRKTGPGEYEELKHFEGNLSDLIDHPELFANYPNLKKTLTTARVVHGVPDSGASGAWNRGKSSAIEAVTSNEEGLLNTLVHEIQHVVQGTEGWPGGGSTAGIKELSESNPDLFQRIMNSVPEGENDPYWLLYRHISGEVEAREAARRRLMSPELREMLKPYIEPDVDMKKVWNMPEK